MHAQLESCMLILTSSGRHLPSMHRFTPWNRQFHQATQPSANNYKPVSYLFLPKRHECVLECVYFSCRMICPTRTTTPKRLPYCNLRFARAFQRYFMNCIFQQILFLVNNCFSPWFILSSFLLYLISRFKSKLTFYS